MKPGKFFTPLGRKVAIAVTGVVAVLLLSASSCSSGDDSERTNLENITCEQISNPTLGQKNLCEREKREENPNAIGYVYLLNFGKLIGYYVIKGKINSSGGQVRPEDDIHWTCRTNHGCQPVVVDGPRDDKTFGEHDPGIFFFLAGGAKVTTNLDYVYSDQPVNAWLDVPQLGGDKKK
jgi:hypothetical protein